eukprot:2817266-Pleurochrysis_carterae.AAC.2
MPACTKELEAPEAGISSGTIRLEVAIDQMSASKGSHLATIASIESAKRAFDAPAVTKVHAASNKKEHEGQNGSLPTTTGASQQHQGEQHHEHRASDQDADEDAFEGGADGCSVSVVTPIVQGCADGKARAQESASVILQRLLVLALIALLPVGIAAVFFVLTRVIAFEPALELAGSPIH